MLATPINELIRPELRHTSAQLKILIAQLTFEVVARGGLIQFTRDPATGEQSLVQSVRRDYGNELVVRWRAPAEPNHLQLMGCATQLYSIVSSLCENELKDRWSRLTSRLSVEELELIREAAKEGLL